MARHRSSRARERKREAGAALVIVLFTLVVIALVAGIFGRTTFTGRRIVANEAAHARAEAMLTAGLNRAIVGLADPDRDRRWHADGGTHDFAFEGGSLTLRVTDEDGKVDLNAAPPPLLKSLLIAAGAAEADAERIVTEIERRRAAARAPMSTDVAQLASRSAAELAQAAGVAPQAPKLFRNSVELRDLDGMTGAIYDALQPLVTVYSGKAAVNAATARTEVLAAVIAIDRPDLAGTLAGDETAALNDAREIVQHLPGASRWLMGDVGPFYTVSVDARTAEGAAASAAFVIWQTGSAYSVIERRERAL